MKENNTKLLGKVPKQKIPLSTSFSTSKKYKESLFLSVKVFLQTLKKHSLRLNRVASICVLTPQYKLFKYVLFVLKVQYHLSPFLLD